MKVEFLMDTGINDGRQILISAAEFRKAKNNREEYNSFEFATKALFSFYGVDDYIHFDEYEKILSALDNKDGAVIITVVEERYRRFYPEVFVSNNNHFKIVEL